MKKILAVCLMMVMVLTMGVSVFAETNGFISSPSANRAPTVVSSSTGDVIITPYSDRDNLPEGDRDDFNGAYNSIGTCDSVAGLNNKISNSAGDYDKDGLAVSDLFHMSSNSSGFDAVLSSDTFKDFVCLIKYDGTEWDVVDGAKLMSDGNLELTGVDSGVYAVVVGTSVATDTPQTGDNGVVYICAAAMIVSAAAIVIVLKKSKKQNV